MALRLSELHPGQWFHGNWRLLASLVVIAGVFVVAAAPVFSQGDVPTSIYVTSLGLASVLVVASAVDATSYRLPDVLTWPLAAAGIVFASLFDWADPLARLLAGVTAYCSLYGLAWAYRRARGRDGLGLGDAKLYCAAGTWLGFEALPVVLLGASVLAIIAVLMTHMSGRTIERTTAIPFGPFLAFSFWIVWLYGVPA